MTARARETLFWAMVAATGAVYGTMLAWTLPEIARAAGGLPPFDMRPLGYDAPEARRFLAALDAQGRALYLGAQHRLDTLFPVLSGLTLAWALGRLAGRNRGARTLLIMLALAAASFDLLENLRVRALLSEPPDRVTEAMIGAASRATQIKSGLATLAYMALLGLGLRQLWHRGRG